MIYCQQSLQSIGILKEGFMSGQSHSDIHKDFSAVQKKINKVFRLQQDNRHEIRHTTPKVRIAKLNKLKTWIHDNRNKIREAVYADFRKPSPEVDVSEIYITLSEIKHAQKHLKKWMKPKRVRRTLMALTTRSWIQYEPKGVVLIISPWNFPFMLALGPFVSALAAGNCAVLKPSELSPNTSQIVREMIHGLFPENEAAVFEGDKEVAAELLKKPFDHIFFTGSSNIGKIVMKAAADNLTNVTLELGGKNPLIVDETAHLQDAAKKIVAGKFVNAGQMCISPDYLFVHKDKAEIFLNALKREIQIAYGEDEQERCRSEDFARIIDQRHYQRLKQLITDSDSRENQIIFGGHTLEKERYIAPTLLTNVNSDSALMQEEIFGPLLPLIPYSSMDEVFEVIADKPIPLTLYIFSNSKRNIQKILSNTSSGNCSINEIGLQFFHSNFPFGGKNQSGIGNTHGFYGFRAFSHERPVLIQSRFSPLKLIYPPYTNSKQKIIDFVVKYL
jgi:aldehyde dehydrogenase (NAD+)